jgi:hypothetical protein
MTVDEELVRRQLASGGWGCFRPTQPNVEVTCLMALALGGTEALSTSARATAVASLLKWQNPDGSWPAFLGDTEGSWVTSLALTVLNTLGDGSGASDRALRWMIEARGREAYWPWRCKFKRVDRNAGFDPDKFGGPWMPGTNSWVIPTAFSLVAIKQFTTWANRGGASVTPYGTLRKHPVGRPRVRNQTGTGEPTTESGLELATNREGVGDRNSDRHAPGEVK